MTNYDVTVIGAGWLGLPLLKELSGQAYRVIGSVTSAEKAAPMQQVGIDAQVLQLTPEPIGNLEALLATHTLLISIPPKAGKLGNDFHPAQVEHLVNAILPSAVKHVIYVSSTSVYPELSRIVEETDVEHIEHSAAPGLSRAEALIQQLALTRKVTIVRCAGLMGYDRIPGKYVAGRTVDSGTIPVNYLHRDDAVGLLQALIKQPVSGTFNAVAPEHPTREAVYRKSCADFGYALPTFVNPATPLPFKIISGEKMTRQFRYVFKYPDPLQFFYQQ